MNPPDEPTPEEILEVPQTLPHQRYVVVCCGVMWCGLMSCAVGWCHVVWCGLVCCAAPRSAIVCDWLWRVVLCGGVVCCGHMTCVVVCSVFMWCGWCGWLNGMLVAWQVGLFGSLGYLLGV